MLSKIIRSDGVTELANIKSVTFREAVNADTDLRPGCVASSYIQVECFGAQTDAPTVGEELTYYQVVGGVDTLIGKFYATPSIPSKATYAFTAYDAANKLEADFSEWLTANQSNFPMTVYALVSAACTVAGVTLGSSSWALSTETVEAFYADGITCRNIVSYAAEIACCFARCDENGELVLAWYAEDYSTETKTGSIASFTGTVAKPMTVVAEINPVQSGTGDPSPTNVRPITGHTGVNVYRTGKNLLNNNYKRQPSGNSTTVYFDSGSTNNYDYYLKAGTYTFSIVYSGTRNNCPYLYYKEQNGSNKNTGSLEQSITFTLDSDGHYRFWLYANPTVKDPIYKDQVVSFQLEVGSTASAYEAYSGDSINITFPTPPGTVYGGTVTINDDGTGTLVVTDANIASYNGETLPGAWMSSEDVYASGTTPTVGAQVVYKLATPVTYALSATQLSTLIGENNVWHDANGNVTVTISQSDTIYPTTSGNYFKAYKQGGLDYANYNTQAIDAVAVHPVGEDDVSYLYPTGVTTGNILHITNNAFLYGASQSLMTAIAQNIYTTMTAMGTYRPFTASLFPNENPFRAGQIVPVEDIQGVRFTSIIMGMTVKESEALVEATGHEVYTEYALDTAKKLIQLAADIVQINKLKVDWAEINQIFANDITVTGQLHSSDYVYEAGKIYANSGMGMDFGDKRFNTPNFGITPDGNVYAQGGQISGFNIRKGDSFQDGYGFPRVIPSVYKTDGTSSTNYTFLDGILEAVDAGYAVYSVPKTNTISSATYNFLNLWFKYTSSVMVAYTGVLNYYDSNNNLLDSDSFSVVPVGSVTVIPKYNLFMNCDHMTVRINYGASAKVQTAFFYGYNYALYTDVPRIGQGANNIYVGNDGISAGEDIIITPDGIIASGQLNTVGNVNVKGETFPTTDANTPLLRFIDSSDVSWGYAQAFRNAGSTRGGVLLSGGYGGYASANQLGLLTETDGTPFVYVTSQDAWLSALNLSSSTTTTTLADIASSGSNTTLTSASYAKWGKVGMIHLVMTRSVNSGTNVDINVAQIVSGKRPAIITSAIVRYTGANVKSYISTAGVVYINTPTSIPSGTELVIDAIYVLA